MANDDTRTREDRVDIAATLTVNPQPAARTPVAQTWEAPPRTAAQDERALVVERAVAGDGRALEQLVRIHSPGIFRFVQRLVRNEQDARDITQEVFLRMIRNLDRYDPAYRFETWLYRIARNLCFDRGRKKQRWKFVFGSRDDEDDREDFIQSLPDEGQNALDATLLKESGKHIEAGIEKLKPAYKEILVLYHFEELSYQEIATVLDIPMGTVMNRLFRARQALKQILGEP